MQAPVQAPISKEEVAHVAHSLWEAAGRPAARDLEFWLEAEKQLIRRHEAVSAAPKESSPTSKSPASATPKSSLAATPVEPVISTQPARTPPNRMPAALGSRH